MVGICNPLMAIISHRGNLEGPNSCSENSPHAIDLALNLGFDCEVDVWIQQGRILLGHDFPEHLTTLDYLVKRKENLWLHCKNTEALEFFTIMDPTVHFFWHQKDDYTITNRGIIWIYPGRPPIKKGVGVLPEVWESGDDIVENISLKDLSAICTDFPIRYFNEGLFPKNQNAS